MKIDFAGIPLCSGERIDSPKGLVVKTTRLLQVTEPLRARQAKNRSRKNIKTDVSFMIQRSHKTVNEAEDFAMNHFADMPESGTLVLTADDGAHRQTKVTYLADAVLESAEVKHNGILSFTTYVFKGGIPQKQKP